MKKTLTYFLFSARILLILLLIFGCEREPVVDQSANADLIRSTFQSNVVRLDSLVFTNMIRTNGQVRFDLIGTPPQIKIGDMVFYSGGDGVFGKVVSVTTIGSRMVFQLEKTGLDKVFKNVSIQDTINRRNLRSRIRTDTRPWNADTLDLDGLFLYNGQWQSRNLQVQFTTGNLYAKSSGGQFILSGQGLDPWFDRFWLDFNHSLNLGAELIIKTGGALDATDSLLVEKSVLGPFFINGFPITYRIDTWLGFHAVTQKDTVLTIRFSGISQGNLAVSYNYWETWKFILKNQQQSANIEKYGGSRLSGYNCEVFVNEVITPYFCGEPSLSLSDRFSATASSNVIIPQWQSSQTVGIVGNIQRSGQVFSTIVPDQLNTSKTLLYSETQTGVLENQPPVPAFVINPTTGFTDTNFEFNASSSSDPETPAESLLVRWDFEGDNRFDTEFSTNKIAFKKFSQPGVYLPVLEVKDGDGLTARVTTTLEVNLSSSAPVAHFTVTPESGRINDIFIFDAYGSFDAEDGINQLKVRWDFDGDGKWDTDWSFNKTAYFIYRVEGKYVPKLEVLDTQELTGSTTRIVNVARANIRPTAFFTFDPEVGTTETRFNFDASGSTDVEDSTKYLQVRWDWENDGIFDTGYRTVKTIQHIFGTAGTFSVVLEVLDTEGYSSTFIKDVKVLNPNTPPTADFTITPSPGKVDALITFDASISTDAEDSTDQLQIRWDWENDNTYDTPFSTDKVYRRTFSKAGSYLIQVEVKDRGGLTDTRVRLLVIE